MIWGTNLPWFVLVVVLPIFLWGDGPSVTGASTHGLTAPPGGAESAFREGATLPSDQSIRAEVLPILYLDVEEAAAGSTPAITVAYPERGDRRSFRLRTLGAAWSPDGSRIAYVEQASPQGSGDALVLSGLNGKPRALYEATAGEILHFWPEWSPDGMHIAIISHSPSGNPWPSTLLIISVASGRLVAEHRLPSETTSVPFPLAGFDNFKWSPTGDWVLISWQRAVAIEVATGRVVLITDGPAIVEWAPQGDAVYHFSERTLAEPVEPKLGDFLLRRLDEQISSRLFEREHLAGAGFRAKPFFPAIMRLSPSQTKMALVVGAIELGGDGPPREIIHLYEFGGGLPLDLTKPARSFEAEHVALRLEWSPDEASMAAIVADKTGIKLRVLDLASGTWTDMDIIATGMGPPDIDVFGLFKTLSWGQ